MIYENVLPSDKPFFFSEQEVESMINSLWSAVQGQSDLSREDFVSGVKETMACYDPRNYEDMIFLIPFADDPDRMTQAARDLLVDAVARWAAEAGPEA